MTVSSGRWSGRGVRTDGFFDGRAEEAWPSEALFRACPRRRSPRCRQAATRVARSPGRASPTSARTARAARPQRSAASRSAASWRELPRERRREPPRSARSSGKSEAERDMLIAITVMRAGACEKARNLQKRRAFLELPAQRSCANPFLRSAAPVERTSDAAPYSTSGGQTNWPFSRRLAKRQRPDPSQVKIFT